MNAEVSIFGVFVPSLLVCVPAAYALTALVGRLLDRFGVYRFVWHRSLFNLCLFVCLLGSSLSLLSRLP